MYYIQKWKIWKGLDKDRPRWADVGFVHQDEDAAADMVRFLERNNRDEPFRYVKREN